MTQTILAAATDAPAANPSAKLSTLRDVFAAAALTSLVGILRDPDPTTNDSERIATNAYRMADAMLRARSAIVVAPDPCQTLCPACNDEVLVNSQGCCSRCDLRLLPVIPARMSE
jgi:hypothetical protein